MTDREAYIAFNLAAKTGPATVARLVSEFGGAAAAWRNFAGKADWRGEAVDWERELESAAKKNVKVVTRADADYPSRLLDLPSPPMVLYVAGDPAALSLPGVAMVGTRLPTLYGTDMAENFAAGIVRGGMSVISGLAEGIDACAHKSALEHGGTTVGVLGGALDRFFPECNRGLARQIVESGGAVVSEYPFGFPPGKATFPQRNRIVAALSQGVLAVEAPAHSGTLITCEWAAKIGRRLMAIPANLDSRASAGCWRLIREGARMVTDADEVLDCCRNGPPTVAPVQVRRRAAPTRTASPAGKASPTPLSLTLEESAVLKAIPSTGITLDRLAFVSKLPAATVSSATVSLRLKKLIRYLPGNRVALSKAQ